MKFYQNMANVIRKRPLITRSVAEPANRNDDLNDFYVFGYQCTLFRDDEKALYIDQGKHLIPWMGNDNLLIDRYDGRGHLHDLSQYDADSNRRSYEPLTDEEQQVEKLCDEERYLELNSDVLEKMLYEEEELKRLNEALASDGSYVAVGFNYDDQNGASQELASEAANECEDEELRPYVPITELNLPPNIILPKTQKIHAIIERTASFTAKHGIQMEIMIKAKQKDNQQFGFLNYDDELNAYYKHLVTVIKQGKYMPVVSSSSATTENDSEDNHAYLHPSLSSASLSVQAQQQPEHISSQEFLESVSAKLPAGQIANTPYAKLLSNLSKHTGAESPQPSKQVTNVLPTRSAQDDVKGMSSSKSLPLLNSEQNRCDSPCDTLHTQYVTSGLDCSPRPSRKVKPGREADFSKKSEEELPVHGPMIIPPPPDIQQVIDKMADYVARNGPEFEYVVRRRNDERFRFLDDDHQHYNYYQYKKSIFLQDIEKKKASKVEEKLLKGPAVESMKQSESKIHKLSNAVTTQKLVSNSTAEKTVNKGVVSFMIKAKEEEAPALRKTTALLYESSDSSSSNAAEDNDEQEADDSGSHSEACMLRHNGMSGVSYSNTTTSKPSTVGSQYAASRHSAAFGKLLAEKSSSSTVSELAVSQIAGEQTANRLTAATYGRFAERNPGKHLQAQRKQRAAAFLTLLKQSDTESPAPDYSSGATSADLSAAVSAPTSRSVTPVISIPSPSPTRDLSPSLERIEEVISPVRSPARTKSHRRHKHRSRSRSSSKSRSRHHKRSYSRSRSKKEKKRTKSPLPVYTRSTEGFNESCSADRTTQSVSRSSHRHSSQSKRPHSTSHKDRSKKYKTKKSRNSSPSPSTSSSYSSSSSDRRSKRRKSSRAHTSRRRRYSSSASSHSSDVNIIEDPDGPAKPQELSEVQAMLQAKRRALLSEEIVILD